MGCPEGLAHREVSLEPAGHRRLMNKSPSPVWKTLACYKQSTHGTERLFVLTTCQMLLNTL